MMISNFVEFVEQKRTEKEPRKRSRGRRGSAEGKEAAGSSVEGRGSCRKLQMTKKAIHNS